MHQEGFETLVLEALRPVWHRMEDVVMELQPAAWKHSNVSVEAGLATLSDFVLANSYSIVTLPHSDKQEAQEKQPLIPPSPCQLLSRREDSDAVRRNTTKGWTNARVLSNEQLQARVRAIVAHPNAFGWFTDVWFAPPQRTRWCRQVERGKR